MSRKENNGNQPLNIKVKPAHHILAGDHKVDFNSGCSVMDMTFPHVFYVEVSLKYRSLHLMSKFTQWLIHKI